MNWISDKFTTRTSLETINSESTLMDGCTMSRIKRLTSLFSQVKKRNSLCSGEHNRIWKGIACVFNTPKSLCGNYASQVHSRVSNINFGIVWGGSRNVSYMLICRFNVLDMHLQQYIGYWSLETFKSTWTLIIYFGFETYWPIGR